MTRQTEHYDTVRDMTDRIGADLTCLAVNAAAMQADHAHALTTVSEALDLLQVFPNGEIGQRVAAARVKLSRWLERVTDPIGHEPSVEHGPDEAVERELAVDDRDALAATVERLYDNIDAALNALDGWPDDAPPNGVPDARRILRNARAGDNPLPDPNTVMPATPLEQAVRRSILNALGNGSAPIPADAGVLADRLTPVVLAAVVNEVLT